MMRKILLIDDEAELCKVVKRYLQHEGKYDVTTAYSGKEGVDKAGDIDFDLVITDYKLPDMDGKAVLDAIKEVKPSMPVVLFSIYHDDSSRISSDVRSKADAIIRKPFHYEEFYRTIEEVLSSPDS